MATRVDPFPAIAAQAAQAADVKRLFEDLILRAETLARMQGEFITSIVRHRSIREGKATPLTAPERRTLANFERDAEQASRDMKQIAAGMDDAALLRCAITGIDAQIQFDEHAAQAFKPVQLKRPTVRRPNVLHGLVTLSRRKGGSA